MTTFFSKAFITYLEKIPVILLLKKLDMTERIEISVTAGYILPLCTLKPKERSGSWEISTRQQQCVLILSQQQQQCPSVRSLRQIKPMRAAMSCPSKGTKSSDIIYDRVWNRKFFFEILPFCQLNEEYQQRENSK